jgi:hypothetical protein
MPKVDGGEGKTSAAPAIILTAVLFLAVGVGGTLLALTEDWHKAAEGALAAGLWMLAGALVLLLIGTPLAFLMLRRLLGEVRGSVTAALDAGGKAARSWDTGDRQSAITSAEQAAKELAAWWARGAVRRWAAAIAIALLAAFGPLLGALLVLRQTALLATQNEIITAQTKKLDEQTITAEATRRNAALNPNLLEVLSQVSRLPVSSAGGLTPISSNLEANIAAFVSVAKSYLYLRPSILSTAETPDRTQSLSSRSPATYTLASSRRPLSPERGILLLALVRQRADFSGLAKARVSFAQADLNQELLQYAVLREVDLQLADLQRADLSNADLRGASLRVADLKDAKLAGADLRDAYMIGADLQRAFLLDADLRGAKLQLAQLQGATVSFANLQGADLSGADLTKAGLSNADMQRASLQRTRLVGADLESVNLQGAYMQSSNLQGAYLRRANLTRVDFRDAKLTGASLQGAYILPVSSLLSSSSELPADDTSALPRPALPKGWESGPPDGWTLKFHNAMTEAPLLPARFELEPSEKP